MQWIEETYHIHPLLSYHIVLMGGLVNMKRIKLILFILSDKWNLASEYIFSFFSKGIPTLHWAIIYNYTLLYYLMVRILSQCNTTTKLGVLRFFLMRSSQNSISIYKREKLRKLLIIIAMESIFCAV